MDLNCLWNSKTKQVVYAYLFSSTVINYVIGDFSVILLYITPNEHLKWYFGICGIYGINLMGPRFWNCVFMF